MGESGILNLVILTAFLEAGVRLGAPLALAALGETLSERGGVLNIGLEGSIICGALGAALGALATGSPTAGLISGALAGAAVAGVFAFFILVLNADQIITGTAITMGGLGLTAALYQARFGTTGTQLSLPTLETWTIPGLSSIPVLGPALFSQKPTVYLAYLLAPFLAWLLFRTAAGLQIRAVGEDPDSAAAAGIRVRMVRLWVTLAGGALAGLAGGHLSIAFTGTFQPEMSAGRGFIAIAVVVLGRWHPVWVLAAALFFGAAYALQTFLQTLGLDIGYQLFLAVPYVLTLLALGGWLGRSRAPTALALPWPHRRHGD
jgi:simple sugar transport system permease protein